MLLDVYAVRIGRLAGHSRNRFALCTKYSVLVFAGAMLMTSPTPTSAADVAAKPVASDAITPKDDVIRLFDGKSLGDCYTWLKDTKREDPRKVFTVSDGMIHISGDGFGGLVTNKRYRDYHLVLEFKFGDRTWHERENRARDSGCLIHSNGKDGGYEGCWMPSIEVQIIEGGVGDFIAVGGPDESGNRVPISLTCTVGPELDRAKQAIWRPNGKRQTFTRGRVDWYGRDPDWKDEKGFRGKDDIESPHGQWTRLNVFCDGGHVETFVNGTKVNEAFDVTPREGRIQLQSELAEIFYRRWELWPLAKGPKPASAKQ
jgi:Domain of Unknown Function (DUF1080)